MINQKIRKSEDTSSCSSHRTLSADSPLQTSGLEMDLETENRIASILMKEAAELRRQADKEGIHAYLQPNVRGRPNSRFLTATVLGVQQANRTVEVNEMWRVRRKEQELEDKLKRRRREESSSDRSYRDINDTWQSTNKRQHNDGERKSSDSYSSSKRIMQESHHRNDKEGLKDDEIEDFLNSRVKRGRGAVGSRMDETGPYLPADPDSKANQLAIPDVADREERKGRFPEKPSRLKSWTSSDDESFKDKCKKVKKLSSSKHSTKHKSKEKSNKDKARKRKEERRHKKRK